MCFLNERKVPPPYSRAGEIARSLNGRRDDEIFVIVSMFLPFTQSKSL